MAGWVAKLAAVAGLCLVLAGCAAPRADNDADRMGRTLIDAIQRNDWIVIDKNLGKAMAEDPDHAPKIVQLQAHFPPEPPWSIKLISSSRTEAWGRPKGAPELTTLNYLYAFADKRLVIELEVEQTGWRRVYEPRRPRLGQPAIKEIEPPEEKVEPPKPKPTERPYKIAKVYKLVSVKVTPVDKGADAANAFFGPRKSLAQWGFLLATFGTPIIMLAAAVAALRAKGLRYKWAWVLAAFLGVGSVWMNWSSGEAGFVWPAVNFLGFGLGKGASPLSPWILKFAPPLGAVVVGLRLALPRRSRL